MHTRKAASRTVTKLPSDRAKMVQIHVRPESSIVGELATRDVIVVMGVEFGICAALPAAFKVALRIFLLVEYVNMFSKSF
jgi:hypothetical protein